MATTSLAGKSGTGYVSLTGRIVTPDTCHGTVWCQCGQADCGKKENGR